MSSDNKLIWEAYAESYVPPFSPSDSTLDTIIDIFTHYTKDKVTNDTYIDMAAALKQVLPDPERDSVEAFKDSWNTVKDVAQDFTGDDPRQYIDTDHLLDIIQGDPGPSNVAWR